MRHRTGLIEHFEVESGIEIAWLFTTPRLTLARVTWSLGRGGRARRGEAIVVEQNRQLCRLSDNACFLFNICL